MGIATGLIGFGLGGRYFHAPFLTAPAFALRAIATRQAEAVAQTFPQADALEDPQALIARPDLDLIVISTPNETHAPLAEAALKAGKHVVIDKPFCLSVAEADRLMVVAQAEKRLLTVYQNRRWDADFRTLRNLMAHRPAALGDLRLVQLRFDRYRPVTKPGWRAAATDGAGVWFDLGPHLLDQALALIGRPDWVQADLSQQGAGSALEDGFSVLLGKGPIRVLLGSTPFAAEAQPRLVVHGTRGTFIKSGLDVQEDQLRAGLNPDAAGFGIEPAFAYGRLIPAAADAEIIPSLPGEYRLFWSALAAAIQAWPDAKPPVDPNDARLGLEIINLARQSHARAARVFLE